LLYLLFGSGFILGPLLVALGLGKLWRDRRRDLCPLGIFLALNLLLIFVWGATGRMFFTASVLMTILLVLGLGRVTHLSLKRLLPSSLGLLGVYAAGAYYLRPYFIAPSRAGVILAVLSLLLTFTLFVVSRTGGRFGAWRAGVPAVLVSSLVVFSGLVVFKHRSVYADVYQTVQRALSEEGRIAYADETGLTAWYFRRRGRYLDEHFTAKEQLAWLADNRIRLVFWTSAHNEGPALTVVEDSRFAERFALLAEFSTPEFLSVSRLYRIR